MADFEVSFSIRKEYKEKKFNWEIAFILISLFHVQIQEPCKQVTYCESICLAKFIIANIWNKKSMAT